ncbi:MAG: SDR family oxidoreductase [Alphaproteobacteria bacterium]|nr:SDR family oxidoreductase [Alphaproteobacteria bacterium]MBU0887411.1 SDR family oxidoreductase [Alphaproteobacteria bacterium]MBU1811708.1 SDR family oxidoreductase [Alphaproteobacteria bacterium]
MKKTLFDLTGKIAVVTGGGRGIGRGIAETLAQHGATVMLASRNEDTLKATAEAIAKAGGKAGWHACDVTDEEDVAALRDATLEAYGQIDILVNNAGIDPHYASMERTDPADWQRIVDVNLSGVFLGCRIIGSAMLERETGSIINISSVAGHVGLKRQVPYCATKGGVEQLTKALALDWAERGVRVNAIAYGFIATDLTNAVITHEHIGPKLLARTPMGRFGTVEEVGGAAVFLASDGATYVTGSTLMVDGGWTAG